MNLSKLGKVSLSNAIKRGRVSESCDREDFLRDLQDELDEAKTACGTSVHLAGVSAYHEELADVILVCLSALSHDGIDADELVKRKVDFNSGRA